MVAQRYNLNANQAFKWRRLFLEPEHAAGVGRFVPVVVEGHQPTRRVLRRWARNPTMTSRWERRRVGGWTSDQMGTG